MVQKRKNKKRVRRLSIPLVGLITVLISYFATKQPDIRLKNDSWLQSVKYSCEKVDNKIYCYIAFEVELINKSLISGYIENIKIQPFRYSPTNIKLKHLDVFEESIKKRNGKKIQIGFEIQSDEFLNNPNNSEFLSSEPIVLSLYDNHKNVVLNDTGEVAYMSFVIDISKTDLGHGWKILIE